MRRKKSDGTAREKEHSRLKSFLKRPLGWKVAEFLSVGISTLIVVGLAGYLVYLSFLPQGPYVAVTVTPLLDQVREEGGHQILPVEVKNGSLRTLSQFKAQVQCESSAGVLEVREFTLRYLGSMGSRVVYLYFDQRPTKGRVTAKPLEYQLE